MKKKMILLLIGLLFVGGCGMQRMPDAGISESTQAESGAQREPDALSGAGASEEESMQGEEAVEGEAEAAEKGTGFFADLPDRFSFSSGAGGWETELYLQDDGTFYGQYHDSEMGSVGEEYPKGTQYISRFEGKFAKPVQVSEYVYSTAIEYLNTDGSDGEYIEDGIRYILCEPYGLENAGEILFYMYGMPHTELPEGFFSWVMGEERGYDSLECYGIYNVNEETGFTGVKIEAFEEIRKLTGCYENEAGDKVSILLSPELDEYTSELGFVFWMPHDGAGEMGSIIKNANGGFTICLEGSILYDFEMTHYETGKIEFSGADQYSEKFGTFVMH